MAWQFYNTDGSAKQRMGTVPGIDDLGDVVISVAVVNDALQYNGTNWVNVKSLVNAQLAAWFYGG